MKKSILQGIISAGLLVACGKAYDLYDPVFVAKKNAETIFGSIDPNHDWSSTIKGTITIVADADLDNIVKVQILTEAPFFNSDALVLNEARVAKGGSVTISYAAPNTYRRLIAACVSKEGYYFIRGFEPGQGTLNFTTETAAARTRADGDSYPNAADLKLEYKNSIQSYNALRTIFANEASAGDDAALKKWVNDYHLNIWEGTGWENERMWCVTNKSNTGTAWTIVNNTIVRNIDPIDPVEKATLTDIYNSSLYKTWNGGKKNNLELIRNDENFHLGDNYLTSDGKTPITIIPVQMNSTETGWNHLYYYYFNPAELTGMSSEQQAQYFRNLPKYKAIQCQHTRSAANKQGNGLADFFYIHEYLLPYYGDGTPTDGQTASAIVFPKGYKIGFVIKKNGNTNVNDNVYVRAVNNGCTYGDGRLNTEINAFPGHFGSAVTAYTMHLDDPRNVAFGANGKTYIAFEDGADCNFCDMIIEVKGGTDKIDEPQNPQSATFTMCFEDRPNKADYDINDVVLKAHVIDDTHVEIALVAAGANDALFIHGIEGSRLNSKTEVHALFGLTSTDVFVNTTADSERFEPVVDIMSKDASETLEQAMSRIWIENKTTGENITMPEALGSAPCAIIVPTDFHYPMERKSITTVYKSFTKWAQNRNNSTDWYMSPESNDIFR